MVCLGCVGLCVRGCVGLAGARVRVGDGGKGWLGEDGSVRLRS